MRLGPFWLLVRTDGHFYAEGGGWAKDGRFAPRVYSKERYAKQSIPHTGWDADDIQIVPVIIRVQRAPWREIVKDMF